ncbi:MAG: hypothetical protein JXR83_12945 [Deltaproteobacteria bacterium]|nr:hypothetical protein [Deltaproteobacteria bacterium]
MRWTAAERRELDRLRTPHAVQCFLDHLPYSADPIYRSPRSVLRDRRAHCFDGAMFAAAALRGLGLPPLLVDLRAVDDDDHVIAVYRWRRHWGAVAKSNCVGLRYREPIHRTLRELVIGYFDDYYNLSGEKTLRSYSRPLDLRRFDRCGWMYRDDQLDRIADALDAGHHFSLLSAAMIGNLAPIDERSYRAGLMGARRAGLYVPENFRGWQR